MDIISNETNCDLPVPWILFTMLPSYDFKKFYFEYLRMNDSYYNLIWFMINIINFNNFCSDSEEKSFYSCVNINMYIRRYRITYGFENFVWLNRLAAFLWNKTPKIFGRKAYSHFKRQTISVIFCTDYSIIKFLFHKPFLMKSQLQTKRPITMYPSSISDKVKLWNQVFPFFFLSFFFFLRKISSALTTASPPLFCWGSLALSWHPYPSSSALYFIRRTPTTAWHDKQCRVCTRDSNRRTPGHWGVDLEKLTPVPPGRPLEPSIS